MSATPQKQPNLTLQACEKIRRAIMLGRMKPGYIISGSSLAKYLGMSRTPIREALQILANEGLVETQNGVGFSVRGITHEELREISEVRTALECTALGTAIRRVPATRLDELINRWNALKEPAAAADPQWLDNIVALDHETHHLITDNGGNRYLSGLIDSIDSKVQRIQHLSVDRENAVDTIGQHTAILERMKLGELAETRALLEEHIRYSTTYIARSGLEDDGENAFWEDVFSGDL